MSVVLIEDCALFGKGVAFPESLSRADARSFARETAMECSIFTPEKTLFGFVRAGVVYVCEKSVLPPQARTARLVIPASALLSAFEPHGVCAFKYGAGVSVFDFGETKKAASACGENALENVMELAGIDAKARAGAAVFAVESVAERGGKLEIKLEKTLPDGTVEHLSARKNVSFFADAELRPPADIAALKRAARVRAAVRACWAVFALALVWLVCATVNAAVVSRDIEEKTRVLAELEPAARQIEAANADALKLLDVLAGRIEPVAALARVNALRPDGVWFARAKFSGSGEISVSGEADSIAKVKKFADALAKNFSVELTTDTARGKTRFSVKLSKYAK